MATLSANYPNVKEAKGKGKAAKGVVAQIPAQQDADDQLEAVLRSFDFQSKYGPCTGITRLQRWERANSLGLNPPKEIRDVLESEAGRSHAECVWHGRV